MPKVEVIVGTDDLAKESESGHLGVCMATKDMHD